MSDTVKMAVLTDRAPGEVRTHLLLNSGIVKTYPEMRSILENYLVSGIAWKMPDSQSGPVPMEVDMITHKGGKGKGKHQKGDYQAGDGKGKEKARARRATRRAKEKAKERNRERTKESSPTTTRSSTSSSRATAATVDCGDTNSPSAGSDLAQWQSSASKRARGTTLPTTAVPARWRRSPTTTSAGCTPSRSTTTRAAG